MTDNLKAPPPDLDQPAGTNADDLSAWARILTNAGPDLMPDILDILTFKSLCRGERSEFVLFYRLRRAWRGACLLAKVHGILYVWLTLVTRGFTDVPANPCFWA